jgi:uncharacterized protein YhaN
MRLLRLELLRYGHLSDVVLDFPPQSALHVVLGANEAGKSTALDAMGDALFGIPERSDRAFLHPGPQLGIGFTLAAEDGARAAFVRRKGRGDTLRDAAGRSVPDAALRPFLGGVDRTRFERGFGLDGARLRRGADDLLRSGGEVGAGLLAGIGVQDVGAALARLEEQAKALHGDGRGKRRLALAIDAYNQARRAMEDAAVRPKEWAEAEAALARIEVALGEAKQQSHDLNLEASRLRRIRAVASDLRSLAEAREDLAKLPVPPPLPQDARARLDRIGEERRRALCDMQRDAAEAARLAEDRAGLELEPDLIALQDRIDDLADRRVSILEAERDLLQAELSVAGYRATVAQAAAALGSAEAPETLRDRVPATPLRRRVAEALSQRETLTLRRDTAAEALARGEAALREADASLQAAPPPPSPEPLRRAIKAASAAGPLDREIATAARALARAREATRKALDALRLWDGEAAALAACPLPLEAECSALAARRADALKARDEARAAVDVSVAEITRLEDEMAQLARGDTVPTQDVIVAARARREAVWQRVRNVLEAGAAAPSEAGLADSFEARRDDADRLADERARDATRAAAYEDRQTQVAVRRARRPEAESRLAACGAKLATAEAAWCAAWAPAGIVPLEPVAMMEWRRDRAEVLRLARVEAEEQEKHDRAAAERETARGLLVAHLPGADAAAPLAALLAAVEDDCARAEAAAKAHETVVQRRDAAARALPELRRNADAAAAKLAELGADWLAAAASLGLAEDASPVAMREALEAWGSIAEVAEAWRGEAQHAAQMRDAIGGFAAETRALAAQLAAEEAPPTVAVLGLKRRLDGARKAQDRDAELLRRIAAHEANRLDAKRRLDAAEEDAAALRALAGAGDDETLALAIEQASRHAALVAETARLGASIAQQGDGHNEAFLRAEAHGFDPDAAAARLVAIGQEQAELAERLGTLGGELVEARTALEALTRGRDAARHAQAAEDALAEARAVADEYACLHLARTLLRAGIERFRRERQDPLLRQAGTHLALLTGGRYPQLLAVQEGTDRVSLRAVRDDGTECPVEALSEGTRDQLFLALRIAAVELHAAQSEPLPFIADDLLVHFDDVRAEAAIALLTRLGRTTQVILFTHHDHIAALARVRPDVAMQTLPAVRAPLAA